MKFQKLFNKFVREIALSLKGLHEKMTRKKAGEEWLGNRGVSIE